MVQKLIKEQARYGVVGRTAKKFLGHKCENHLYPVIAHIIPVVHYISITLRSREYDYFF